MSRSQDPQRPFFPFGNPFKMMLPKGSHLSPNLLTLLNTFEAALANRLRKLEPKGSEEILSLSWMKLAMKSLNDTHNDIKTLITSLELPVCNWDEKWIDVYLNNSVKLLDLCNSFISEISRLNQGHLFLQCVLYKLNTSAYNQAHSSLESWKKHMGSGNKRLEACFSILGNLTEMINHPKVKNSAKGKVLMQAMYGVKVVTVFVCSVFASALSGSANKLMDLQVSETHLWADAFKGLQAYVNREIRNMFSSQRVTILKELEAVHATVNELCPMLQDGAGAINGEALENSISELGLRTGKLSQGLDVLEKEVNEFFQIVLTGRDALLCNLRMDGSVFSPVQGSSNVGEQLVL